MKILATRGKEQTICEQTNKKTQTKCRFPNCSFLQNTQKSYMQMQAFIFSFLNVMNGEKKLGALNKQFKCLLL